MPVVINEIDVIDQGPPAPTTPAARPPATGTPDLYDTMRLLLRDLDGRQRRLVAD